MAIPKPERAGLALAAAVAAGLACGTRSPEPPTNPTHDVALDAGPIDGPIDAGPIAQPADASRRSHPTSDKHWDLDMSMDGDGGVAPRNHTEKLWGDYIDRDGKPAVGWHSHDPKTGNAQ